jgi:hypothetical protein
MVLNKRATVDTVAALLRNSPMMFLTGAITVIAGLAMVLGHNIWSGGAVTVIVTIVGWVTLIKGLLFLMPEAAPRVYLGALQFEQLFYLYAAVSILLGIYLTYSGFTGEGK